MASKPRNGLVNYTTEVDAQTSVLAIQGMLLKAGARELGLRTDGLGNVTEIAFQLEVKGERVPFRLPADPDATLRVLNRQASAGNIPKRYGGDREQARRVAWRILLYWLESQLALIEIEAVQAAQVLLPYAVTPDDRTVYQTFAEAPHFGQLALPAPTKGGTNG